MPEYSTGVTDHGEPYLIMPFYEDGSLQDRMADGPVPWREAVEYITHAATTMTAAAPPSKPSIVLFGLAGESGVRPTALPMK